jgi:porin
MAGVFNGDPDLGENTKHGLDWTWRGPLFAIAEIGYRLTLGADIRLPGTYKVGGYYNGGAFEDLLRDETGGVAVLTGRPPRTVNGNTGLYLLGEQMIYRERAASAPAPQGLSAFVACVLAPDQSINRMPFFIDGGLVYRGLIPRRDNDVAGFAVMYGRFSDDLRRAQRSMRRAGLASPIQQYELVLEWTYAIQATPWLTVQPDVQYIVRPGGSGAVPNALVLGTQLSVSF